MKYNTVLIAMLLGSVASVNIARSAGEETAAAN